MKYYDAVRHAILITIVVLLIIRLPTLRRHTSHTYLWGILGIFLCGAIIIQPQTGRFIDTISGVPETRNLVSGCCGVINIACTAGFVAFMHDNSTYSPPPDPSEHYFFNNRPRRFTRHAPLAIIAPALTIAAMITLFALMPDAEQIGSGHHSSAEIIYSLIQAAYIITASSYITVTLFLLLSDAATITMKISIFFIAFGTATEIPFMIIRTLQRLYSVNQFLLDTAFYTSAIRFFLVPVGCSFLLLEKYFHNLWCYFLHIAIYRSWRTISYYTPHTAITPIPTWSQELRSIRNSYNLTYLRLVEIRDSILYLLDNTEYNSILSDITQKYFGSYDYKLDFFDNRPMTKDVIFWRHVIAEFHHDARNNHTYYTSPLPLALHTLINEPMNEPTPINLPANPSTQLTT